MIALICGGRQHPPFGEAERAFLNDIQQRYGFTMVYHGDASGADRQAAWWAKDTGLDVVPYPANWQRFGKQAGPMRNTAMVDHALRRDPQVICIAFTGGRGTADLVAKATAAQIPVIHFPLQETLMETTTETVQRDTETTATQPDLLTLCSRLQEAGIWLYLTENDSLTMGPSALVKKHPELLQGVRTHKAALLRLLQDSLAHGVFGTKTDDPRFEREVCPDCQQACPVILSPRRLAVHRTTAGTTVCPGSNRSQAAATSLILESFIKDRCLDRRMAVLSWHALRGALTAWCLERDLFLPPRPFILAWLDTQYRRHGEESQPSWEGLALTLEEWGLEDELCPLQKVADAVPQAGAQVPTATDKPKLVLTA